MKTLLILGGLSEFTSLVRRAKELGLRTIVADGNENAPAKALADASYTVDVRDIDTLCRIVVQEHVDCITTAYSDLLLECMVKVAAQTHLPCHIHEDALPYYRNKAVIHTTCQKIGLATPKATTIQKNCSLEDLKDMQFPMVVKPLDLYGSRGIQRVLSMDDIRDYFHRSDLRSEDETFLAEVYNPDPEYNIQCWVRHGKVHLLGLCDREKTDFTGYGIPLSTRNVYPASKSKQIAELALSALTRYIAETGQKEGPLCMQFYYSMDRGLQIGEIAARFLGYEHELIEYTSGVSVEDLLLASCTSDSAMDDLLRACHPLTPDCHAAVVYFHARDGVTWDLSGLEEASQLPGVCYTQIFYQRGQRIGSPQNMPYAARFYVKATSRALLDDITTQIRSVASLKDTNGQELLLKESTKSLTQIQKG